jgi:hypothetical protein
MVALTRWAKLRLFLESALWLALARVAIGIAPFHRIGALVGLAPGEGPRGPRSPEAARVGWAVRAAVVRLPWHSTCLCQALAAAVMLRRMGISGTLHLGVGRDPAGALSFHAWLRCNDMVVTGDEGRERYISMSTFKTFPNEKRRS